MLQHIIHRESSFIKEKRLVYENDPTPLGVDSKTPENKGKEENKAKEALKGEVEAEREKQAAAEKAAQERAALKEELPPVPEKAAEEQEASENEIPQILPTENVTEVENAPKAPFPTEKKLKPEEYRKNILKLTEEDITKRFDIPAIVDRSAKSKTIPDNFNPTISNDLHKAHDYFLSVGIYNTPEFQDTFFILEDAIKNNPFRNNPEKISWFTNPEQNLVKIEKEAGDFGRNYSIAYQNFTLMKAICAKVNNDLLSAVTHAQNRNSNDALGVRKDVEGFIGDIGGAIGDAWKQKDWMKLALFGGGIWAAYKFISSFISKEDGDGKKWGKRMLFLAGGAVGISYLLKESGHDVLGNLINANTDKELFGPMQKIAEKDNYLKTLNINFPNMARLAQVDAKGLHELKKNATQTRKISGSNYPNIFKIEEFNKEGISSDTYNSAVGLEAIYYNIIQRHDQPKYGNITYEKFLTENPGITVASIVSIATLLENMPKLQANAERFHNFKQTLTAQFPEKTLEFQDDDNFGIDEHQNLNFKLYGFPVVAIAKPGKKYEIGLKSLYEDGIITEKLGNIDQNNQDQNQDQDQDQDISLILNRLVKDAVLKKTNDPNLTVEYEAKTKAWKAYKVESNQGAITHEKNITITIKDDGEITVNIKKTEEEKKQ